jgi:hypothetical protein
VANKKDCRAGKMKRAPEFEIDPFLLPTCDLCGGPVNLSHIEPATDHMPVQRVYRCSRCGAEKVVPSTDRPNPK